MKKNNKNKKVEYNKKLLIFLIVILIIYFILQGINNKNKTRIDSFKLSASKEYVYTKATNTNNSKVPYVNLFGSDAQKVNNQIDTLTKEYLESNNKNKSITYRYNQNKNILSVVLIFKNINEYQQLYYNYKTYVFDIKAGCKLLTNDQILKKFNITYAQVNEVMKKTMQQKYIDEVKKGFIDKNECNYACYLEHRNIKRYIDNANYYIENSHLIVYRAFEVYSIFGEEDYFTRNDFKFLIK